LKPFNLQKNNSKFSIKKIIDLDDLNNFVDLDKYSNLLTLTSVFLIDIKVVDLDNEKEICHVF